MFGCIRWMNTKRFVAAVFSGRTLDESRSQDCFSLMGELVKKKPYMKSIMLNSLNP